MQGGAKLFSRGAGPPAGLQALGPVWGEDGAADANACRPAMLPVGTHDAPGGAKGVPRKKWTPGCCVDSVGAQDADLPPAWGAYSHRTATPLPPLVPTATVSGRLGSSFDKETHHLAWEQ